MSLKAPSTRPQQLEVGTTYHPSGVGPYLWHEFEAEVVARDFAAIAASHLQVVRVMLSWDAFMPTDRVPNPRRMRDFETMLRLASETGLRLVPTLFVQSLGDCVLLPAYAVDRRHPRRGVRCLTDGRPAQGGPRDVYADPLMLETQVRWLDSMLAAFAHHPAIAAWDLGHDPSRTVRPRRIEQMREWAALLGERVRAQDEECRLTLGQGDIVGGRAVRLHLLATAVDRIGLVLRPQQLRLPGDSLAVDNWVFVVALALALLGDAAPLHVDVGMAVRAEPEDEGNPLSAHPETVGADAPAVVRACDQLFERLVEIGVTAITATAWTDWGVRLVDAPPADRAPWLSSEGIVDSAGENKLIAEAWRALAGVDRAVAAVDVSAGFPAPVDADEYYAHLPDALLDLHATWEGRHHDPPAILG